MSGTYVKGSKQQPHFVALTLLVLAGFLLKAVIPAGFMPSAAVHDGLVEMVICSGMGEKTVLLHEDGSPAQKGEHKAASSKPCEYGFLTGQKNLAAAPAVFVPTSLVLIHLAADPAEQNLASITLLLSFARGPPSFSV